MGAAPAAAVIRIEGDRVSAVIPVDRRHWVIGREGDCDLVLEDPRVSRHHARLEFEGGGVRLRDLGSANGTFVGETRVGEEGMWLDLPAEVRVGRTVLQVVARNDSTSQGPALGVDAARAAPLPPSVPQREGLGQKPAPASSQRAIERPKVEQLARNARFMLGGAGVIASLGGLLAVFIVGSGQLRLTGGERLALTLAGIFSFVLGTLQLATAVRLGRPSQRAWMVALALAAVGAGVAAFDVVSLLDGGSIGIPALRLGLNLGALAGLIAARSWYRTAAG